MRRMCGARYCASIPALLILLSGPALQQSPTACGLNHVADYDGLSIPRRQYYSLRGSGASQKGSGFITEPVQSLGRRPTVCKSIGCLVGRPHTQVRDSSHAHGFRPTHIFTEKKSSSKEHGSVIQYQHLPESQSGLDPELHETRTGRGDGGE